MNLNGLLNEREKLKSDMEKEQEKIIQHLSENQKKRIRTFRVRTRFTISFFAIVFPMIIVTIGVFYLLTINGVPLYKLSSSSLVTLFIAVLCVIFGYAISYLLMNTVFTPLEELNEAAKKVAAGEYDVKLHYNGVIEEIQTTIDNFNFMTQELNSVEIMRNDFIASVSHEFKTPLSSINGYVTLLQDPELSEMERKEYMDRIFFNIEKVNDLSSNILQLSKLENQTTLPAPVTYRLDEQIREAIVLLFSKWNEKNIELDIDMEEVVYTGQQSLLLHVWTNLIGNAIKFSDENSQISIRLKKTDSQIEIIVEDQGIGLDENTRRHIFEKFYQGDSSRKAQGNGLGLPLCKEIMKKCGGKIQVESELGVGTRFIVTL